MLGHLLSTQTEELEFLLIVLNTLCCIRIHIVGILKTIKMHAQLNDANKSWISWNYKSANFRFNTYLTDSLNATFYGVLNGLLQNFIWLFLSFQPYTTLFISINANILNDGVYKNFLLWLQPCTTHYDLHKDFLA